MKYNPTHLPSPRELGFREGSPVIQLGYDIEFRGVVTRVEKNHIEVSSGPLLIKCHPEGRFALVHGPYTQDMRKP